MKNSIILQDDLTPILTANKKAPKTFPSWKPSLLRQKIRIFSYDSQELYVRWKKLRNQLFATPARISIVITLTLRYVSGMIQDKGKIYRVAISKQ